MYNFVFWFFYRFFEWRKDFKSTFLSAAMVALTMLIHMGLLYAIVRYFTGFASGTFNDTYSYNKIILLPLVVGWFFVVYLVYYRTRTDQVLEKYADQKFSGGKNIFLVFLIIVIPLIIAIKLTNLSVVK